MEPTHEMLFPLRWSEQDGPPETVQLADTWKLRRSQRWEGLCEEHSRLRSSTSGKKALGQPSLRVEKASEEMDKVGR